MKKVSIIPRKMIRLKKLKNASKVVIYDNYNEYLVHYYKLFSAKIRKISKGGKVAVLQADFIFMFGKIEQMN